MMALLRATVVLLGIHSSAAAAAVAAATVLLSGGASQQAQPRLSLQECVDAAAAAAARACGGEPVVCTLPSGTHAVDEPVVLPAFPTACPLVIRGAPSAAGAAKTTTLSGLSPVAVLSEWTPRCIDQQSSTAHLCSTSPIVGARVRMPWRFTEYQQLVLDHPQQSAEPLLLHRARWPNVLPPNASNRHPLLSYVGAWRNVSNGSETGRIVSPELAGSAVNWTGGTIMSVFKTQYTFTRTVTAFDPVAGAVSYPVPSGPGEGGDNLWGRFWLSGVLGALDTPGEWHFEQDPPTTTSVAAANETVEGTLLYFPPDPQAPHNLLAKGIAFAMQSVVAPKGHRIAPTANVHIEGLRFLGVTVSISGENCSVIDCDFVYPSFQPDIPEMASSKAGALKASYTRFDGDNFRVQRVSVRHTPHPTFFYGRNVSVDNLLVEDQGWWGTLQYPAIDMRTVDSIVSNAEIRHVGNVGLTHHLWKYDADHVYFTNASRMTVTGCYIHHGCILAEDCALLYSGNIYLNGTVWSRSFLHHSGQMCMRFDDHSRNGTVSRVLAFNCGTGEVPWTPVPWGSAGGSYGHGVGGLFKGDFHRLSHITAYNTAMNSISLAGVCSSSTRCNNQSVVEAVAAVEIGTAFGRGVAGWRSEDDVVGKPTTAWRLRNPPSDTVPSKDWDPRPEPGSMLCDAAANAQGAAGAFACSDDPALNWRPGCTLDGCTQWR